MMTGLTVIHTDPGLRAEAILRWMSMTADTQCLEDTVPGAISVNGLLYPFAEITMPKVMDVVLHLVLGLRTILLVVMTTRMPFHHRLATTTPMLLPQDLMDDLELHRGVSTPLMSGATGKKACTTCFLPCVACMVYTLYVK